MLTPFGVELVRRYRALEHQTEVAVARKLKLDVAPASLGQRQFTQVMLYCAHFH